MIFAGSANGSSGVPAPVLDKIHHHVKVTHHYQDLAHVNRTPYHYAAEHTTNPAYRLWLNERWYTRQVNAVIYYRDHRQSLSVPEWFVTTMNCISTKEEYGVDGTNTIAGYFGFVYPPYEYGGVASSMGTSWLAVALQDQYRVAYMLYNRYGFSPWSTHALCGV